MSSRRRPAKAASHPRQGSSCCCVSHPPKSTKSNPAMICCRRESTRTPILNTARDHGNRNQVITPFGLTDPFHAEAAALAQGCEASPILKQPGEGHRSGTMGRGTARLEPQRRCAQDSCQQQNQDRAQSNPEAKRLKHCKQHEMAFTGPHRHPGQTKSKTTKKSNTKGAAAPRGSNHQYSTPWAKHPQPPLGGDSAAAAPAIN